MWKYAITLIDQRRLKTTLTFDLETTVVLDYASAVIAANSIRGSLVDITNAFVALELLTEVRSEDGTVPADADITDELAISCFINDAADKEKLHTLRVPAPIDAVWQPDGKTLDMTNALVIQYVQQIAQHAFVSDGEQINDSIQNGMKNGYWRSKSRSAK